MPDSVANGDAGAAAPFEAAFLIPTNTLGLGSMLQMR